MSNPNLSEYLNEMIRRLAERNPELFTHLLKGGASFRYYDAKQSNKKTVWFCYTTERVDGKFVCYNMVSIDGKHYHTDRDSIVKFSKRTLAKSRALDRYISHVAKYNQHNERKFNRLVASGRIEIAMEQQ